MIHDREHMRIEDPCFSKVFDSVDRDGFIHRFVKSVDPDHIDLLLPLVIVFSEKIDLGARFESLRSTVGAIHESPAFQEQK